MPDRIATPPGACAPASSRRHAAAAARRGCWRRPGRRAPPRRSRGCRKPGRGDAGHPRRRRRSPPRSPARSPSPADRCRRPPPAAGQSRAAAIASTPVPPPMSATRRGREPRLRQPVEREQAALRRRVVPGAEGLRRLDLEPDAVRRHPAAVVAAVDHEPPGLDRRQLGAHLRHPVAVVDALDREVRRAVHLGEQRQPGRVGRPVEQPAGVPAPRPVVVVVHLARQRRRRQPVERVAQRDRRGLAATTVVAR